ncbi:MAG: S8 family serine peptidase [Anaerolineae bacterium]
MNWRKLSLFLLLLALLCLPSSPASSQQGMEVAHPLLPPPGKVEPTLLKEVLQAKDGQFTFLVYLREEPVLPPPSPEVSKLERRRSVVAALQETAERTQEGIRRYLEEQKARGRVQSYTSFWVFNGLAVTGDRETLLDLAARPEVKIIRADHKRWLEEKGLKRTSLGASAPSAAVEWNIARVRADLVWKALGINGTGVVIASMDTGVDWQHPALAARYRGYNAKGLPVHTGNWYSATDEGYLYPGDGHGHGTHVLGIALGEGGIGVAPGARWIAVKVFHNQGHTYDSWLHAGFQWLLAPAGDPALAPDIINASWGNDISGDETFRPDVQALRAAGILPVFAAGNYGPQRGTIGSPASFPEAFAVGATDSDDEVASLSGRGPSPWGEIKPEVSAPGMGIRSSLPGGSYGTWNGTSMAAPHVSGLAALLLQAQPSLTIPQIEEVITSTAVPLGDPVPNNDYGWGRIDAYAAVASVANAGYLEGQVTKAVDGTPLPGATIRIAERDGSPFLQVTADAQGYYAIALPPGTYDVTAGAFAYRATTVRNLTIAVGITRRQDFVLELLPAGILYGQVTDEDTGGPLAATVAVLDTPVVVETDPLTGRYTIPLPPGSYAVKVSSPGYRIRRFLEVTIVVDQVTRLDFALPPAPTILLVDSGAWYYGSQIRYFQEALDDQDYLYDTWTIKDLPQDVPQAEDLAPYDITVWSSPFDAPGFIGASDTITLYLEAGGRLFLTGQDIGYWDGGGSLLFFFPYYRDYLQAVFLEDESGTRNLSGRDILDGLELILNGGDGANNQHYPDVIAPLSGQHTSSVIDYWGGKSAGLRVGLCLPYRVVYFAFGFEGLNSRTARAEVMGRIIEGLMAPLPAAGLTLTPEEQTQVALPGSVVTYTLSLRNTGRDEDTYHLSLGWGWPASLWDKTFTTPLSETVTMSSCTSLPLGVRVEVPPETGWNRSRINRLRAESSHLDDFGRPLMAVARLTTKTPASILLVDDDRWYNVEGAYQTALEANDYPYDRWEVGWNVGQAAGRPDLARLQMYPLVLWFTGYDWHNTLTPAEEEELAAYLDGGGRLFFSAQDYLYTNGLTPFGLDYLGVLTYTEDLTSTVVAGLPGDPVGQGLGPYELDYPYGNHSDGLVPTASASPAFRGEDGQVAALTHPDLVRGFKTVFFAFPFEALPPEGAQTVMGRIIEWLNPMTSSTMAVDKPVAAGGDRLTYTVVLRNDGVREAREARLFNRLPGEVSYVGGSLKGGATYNSATHTVIWKGDIAPGGSHAVTYQVALPAHVDEGTVITNVVEINDGAGIKFQRAAITRVNVPDLSPSTKWVEPGVVQPGDVVTYNLALRNRGTLDAAAVTVTDQLPATVAFVPGSLWFSAGQAEEAEGVIRWTGPVARQPVQVLITYQARVLSTSGGTIANVARIEDGFGQVIDRQATIVVPIKLYFPFVCKGKW